MNIVYNFDNTSNEILKNMYFEIKQWNVTGRLPQGKVEIELEKFIKINPKYNLVSFQNDILFEVGNRFCKLV